jgi:hypothetical protein
MTADRSERSHAHLTDDHLARLADLAAIDDRDFRQRHPDWATELLACCLVQGGARHYVYGDRGIKDLDIYLFYALPAGRNPAHFPWNRGGATRTRDLGSSQLGRQLYTDADRANPKIAKKIAHWETFMGRRIDIMSRCITPHPDSPRAAVVQWLERGRRHMSAPGRTDWNLSMAPVVCLHPVRGEIWWRGPAVDGAGIAKGANGVAAATSDRNQ